MSQLSDSADPSVIMPGKDSNQIPAEVVVGVDVGLTYTGIAFATLESESEEPGIVNQWPNSEATIVNKVPTTVRYRAGKKNILSWGFGCVDVDRGNETRTVELFKFFLDDERLQESLKKIEKDYRKNFISSTTADDVAMWYQDFLTAICRYTTSFIANKLGINEKEWNETRVDFIFSVPTIWKNGSAVKKFREIIISSGFQTHNHTVSVELTEAEAAAACTTRRPSRFLISHAENEDMITSLSNREPKLREGHVLLVCDSGGGTTDVCLLEIVEVTEDESGRREVKEMKHLTAVEGRAIGSIRIDNAFEEEVERRLRLFQNEGQDYQVDEFAPQEMLRKTFRSIKESFGSRTAMNNYKIPVNYKIRIPGLNLSDISHLGAKIENGKMIFTSEDIEAFFDIQITRMISFIDEQIEVLKERLPEANISYFIFSGGLCSSKYVQQRIWEVYGSGVGGEKNRILVSDVPQLAVCKGLVMDHIHRINHNRSIISTRCCHVSYGIVYHELYERAKHSKKRLNIKKNEIDGKDYVTDRICWLVREGTILYPSNPITQKLYRIVDEKTRNWKDKIVISHTPHDRLPNSLYEGDAKVIGTIDSSFTGELDASIHGVTKFQTPRYPLLSKHRKVWWKIEHDVLVHLESASLRFEIKLGKRVLGLEDGIPIHGIQFCMGSKDHSSFSRLPKSMESEDTWYTGLLSG